jgi:cytochrome c oxidase assembly factor CtaG
MLYLWVAMGVVDTVPSSFLLFASYPLYRTYELAARVHGISATVDQQFAGVIMKLGGMFFIFPVTAVIFYRAWQEDLSAAVSRSAVPAEGRDPVHRDS